MRDVGVVEFMFLALCHGPAAAVADRRLAESYALTRADVLCTSPVDDISDLLVYLDREILRDIACLCRHSTTLALV